MVGREGWVEVETIPIEDPTNAPLCLALDDRPIDPADPFLYHKTTNRRVYDEARERHPEVDDVVLWNPDKLVTETTISNLAALIDGVWVTPPTADGCLAGTFRSELLESGELVERSISIDELLSARSVARLNSLRGWEQATIE